MTVPLFNYTLIERLLCFDTEMQDVDILCLEAPFICIFLKAMEIVSTAAYIKETHSDLLRKFATYRARIIQIWPTLSKAQRSLHQQRLVYMR